MRRKVVTLPPLPDSVPSQLGAVPVTFVPDLKTRAGEDALGIWDGELRIIKVRSGLPLVVSWQVLRHEQIHQVLWDAGFTDSLTDTQHEILCDSLASARVAEMLASGVSY